MAGRSRQGGWAGLIVLLLALCVVAWLSRTLLGQTGLLGSDTTTATRSRPLPPTATSADVAADAASATPRQALERAKALEQQVREQAREYDERIDRTIRP